MPFPAFGRERVIKIAALPACVPIGDFDAPAAAWTGRDAWHVVSVLVTPDFCRVARGGARVPPRRDLGARCSLAHDAARVRADARPHVRGERRGRSAPRCVRRHHRATNPPVFMSARQMFGGGVSQRSATLALAGFVMLLWGRSRRWQIAGAALAAATAERRS
jgi:hypothetical protein